MTDEINKHSSDNQGILTGSCMPVDQEPEILSLRPEQLADYVGQSEVVEALKIAIEAAVQRREPMGRPALGKQLWRILLPMKWELISPSPPGLPLKRAGT